MQKLLFSQLADLSAVWLHQPPSCFLSLQCKMAIAKQNQQLGCVEERDSAFGTASARCSQLFSLHGQVQMSAQGLCFFGLKSPISLNFKLAAELSFRGVCTCVMGTGRARGSAGRFCSPSVFPSSEWDPSPSFMAFCLLFSFYTAKS